MRQGIARELRPQEQVSRLVAGEGLAAPNGRLEQLLELGLVRDGYKRQADIRDLRGRGCGLRRCGLRRAAAKRVGHLRRRHACGLGDLGWRLGRLELLLGHRGIDLARLEGLLRRRLLEALGLLAWIPRRLRLEAGGLRLEASGLWLEALRLLLLPREARELALQRSAISRGLRLEALGLLERLLLLAVLGLAGAGAVGAA